MLAAGNVEVTDLLCVTPPSIPEGAHAMTQLVELPPQTPGSRRIATPDRYSGTYWRAGCSSNSKGDEPREIVAGQAFWEPGGDAVHYQMANRDPHSWTRVLAVCICAPDVDMITMLEPDEIAARDHLRHPSIRRHAD